MTAGTGLLAVEGGYRIDGELTFDTVVGLYRSSPEFASGTEVVVDLGQVRRVDSAGLALLLHWAGECDRRGSRLVIRGATAQMQSMMAIAGLDRLVAVA